MYNQKCIADLKLTTTPKTKYILIYVSKFCTNRDTNTCRYNMYTFVCAMKIFGSKYIRSTANIFQFPLKFYLFYVTKLYIYYL